MTEMKVRGLTPEAAVALQVKVLEAGASRTTLTPMLGREDDYGVDAVFYGPRSLTQINEIAATAESFGVVPIFYGTLEVSCSRG